MTIMGTIKYIIGDENLGYLDYFRSSTWDRNWVGPFNGQKGRCQLFSALCSRFRFEFLVETGTFRGVTTEYIASLTKVPVITIESNLRNYGFARARLRNFRRVQLYKGDSVEILQMLFDKQILPERLGFYYLDAHWDERLPLRQEMSLIFMKRPFSIVMADDFQVPDDPGYFYDNYGNEGALKIDYISETILQYRLFPFFPSCPSNAETGKRRGTIVLTTAALVEELRQVVELRELPED